VEGQGGRRVAGDDQQLDPAPDEQVGGLQRITEHGIGTLRAVGNACGITEIERGFRRQRLPDGPQDGEPADARIEDADGQIGVEARRHYSTVTDLARLRGWSTSVPRRIATW